MAPTLPVSEQTHSEKYRSPGESFEERMNAMAAAISDDADHYHQFRRISIAQRFMGAGRTQAAVGSSRNITAYNCFVSGEIEDNFVEGIGQGHFFAHGGIMARAAEAAQTMRMGGGIGYNISKLRPRGELIKSSQSRSSGAVSFMDIYDGVCRATMSAGHRRGAQMMVLNVDHPDIEEFISCKQPPKEAAAILEMLEKYPPQSIEREKWMQTLQTTLNLTGFNISVGITDEFMKAVIDGTDFDLRWGGKTYKTIDARTLWEKIMRSTWDYAEPGVIFLDTINRMNPLWYCEYINTTNPCGEQPLPPYCACLLGSFNLTKYIYHDRSGYKFNWQQLIADIPAVVRAMDNIIDETIYPLPQQEAEAFAKRRMGLGITGFANASEALGHPYGTASCTAFLAKVLRTILEGSYRASALLAEEKGPFPLFDAERYLSGPFIKTLSKKTRALIQEHGLRNSHLTSIAPTGTISLCADNPSSGIEPVFAYSTDRAIRSFDTTEIHRIPDYGVREFHVHGKLAEQCTVDDHLAVLIEAQKHVDSAVSKTCNVNPNMPWEEFKQIYIRAWQGGVKGCTTFNPQGKRMGIMKNAEACVYDPTTGTRTCE